LPLWWLMKKGWYLECRRSKSDYMKELLVALSNFLHVHNSECNLLKNILLSTLICLAPLKLLVSGGSSYVWQITWRGSLSEPILESAFSKHKLKPPAFRSRRLKKQQKSSQICPWIWYRQFLWSVQTKCACAVS
jgi:hypothetical protein